MTIYNRAIRQRNKVRAEIQKCKEKLVGLPEGQIIISKNKNRYKWYISYGDKKREYLSKDNIFLASQLMYKKYILFQIDNLEREEKAITAYLKIQKQNPHRTEQEFLEHPEHQKLLTPYLPNTRAKLKKWMNEPYARNPHHPENLVHKSASGNVFRSKSEAMIETMLLEHGLFFHYEEELQLGDVSYYPDFKIVHPVTGKYLYWENVGMIDKPEYLNRFLSKLQNYILNGLIPGVNLILTFETKDHPLTMETIEEIVEKHFE